MEKYIGLLLKAACYDDDKNSLVVLAQHAKEGPNTEQNRDYCLRRGKEGRGRLVGSRGATVQVGQGKAVGREGKFRQIRRRDIMKKEGVTWIRRGCWRGVLGWNRALST